jgi:hypothetical protein
VTAPIKRVKNINPQAWRRIKAWGELRGLEIGPALELLIDLQEERERLAVAGAVRDRRGGAPGHVASGSR